MIIRPYNTLRAGSSAVCVAIVLIKVLVISLNITLLSATDLSATDLSATNTHSPPSSLSNTLSNDIHNSLKEDYFKEDYSPSHEPSDDSNDDDNIDDNIDDNENGNNEKSSATQLASLKSSLHASLSPTSPPLLHFGRLISPHLSSPKALSFYNLHSQKLTDYYGGLAQAEIEGLPLLTKDGEPYEPETAQKSCEQIKEKYLKEVKSAMSAARVCPTWPSDALEDCSHDLSIIISRKMSQAESEYMATSSSPPPPSELPPPPKTIKGKVLAWFNKQLNRKLWYKRFLNQVIALGLNYAQGTLALRAIRREAERRDREIPKWPI